MASWSNVAPSLSAELPSRVDERWIERASPTPLSFLLALGQTAARAGIVSEWIAEEAPAEQPTEL